MAAVAGPYIRNDAAEHLAALRLLVADYIAVRSDNEIVDWEFVALRNMGTPDKWKAEDKARHSRALEVLAASGYAL